MWLVEDGSGLDDPELVGHKFARQVELAREGFSVPPLVCVPATVFDRVVGPALAEPSIVDPASASELTGWASELRQRIHRVDVPPELRRVLDDCFDDIAGPGGMVAVRACVVPRPGELHSGEDSAEDPFAGLSDSFLYVRRAELAERLVACWASAFNSEAVLYRAQRGRDPFGRAWRWGSSAWSWVAGRSSRSPGIHGMDRPAV